MKRSHGPNSKHSRNLVRKEKPTISVLLRKFSVGDKVRVSVNPSFKRGTPSSLRFNNSVGEVIGTQGRSYRVRMGVKGAKQKELLVTNVHLQKV